jgi:hypothetical protein
MSASSQFNRANSDGEKNAPSSQPLRQIDVASAKKVFSSSDGILSPKAHSSLSGGAKSKGLIKKGPK